MAISLIGFLFLLVSSATACDRCLRTTKVAHFSTSASLSSGACGYGSLAPGFNRGFLAAAGSSLFNDGAGCGACFMVRCNINGLCRENGTKVFLFDHHNQEDDQTDFVLSGNAFKAMAVEGKGRELLRMGTADVEYKRVPCDYPKNNLSIRVEESRKDYLSITFLYQGGQTEIVGVDIAQANSSNWGFMSRNHGAVWETSRVRIPKGSPNRVPETAGLQMRLTVTGGYDGKKVWIKNALPEILLTKHVYDTGVQIDDIAQEGCFPCDDSNW